MLLAALLYTITSFWSEGTSSENHHRDNRLLSADRLAEDYRACAGLRAVPKDPSGPREQNARYSGSKAVLIKNATVWTGEPTVGTTPEQAHAGGGYSWIQTDVLLEHGLIKLVAADILESEIEREYDVYHANGRLLTSGIVDMHSHAGTNNASI